LYRSVVAEERVIATLDGLNPSPNRCNGRKNRYLVMIPRSRDRLSREIGATVRSVVTTFPRIVGVDRSRTGGNRYAATTGASTATANRYLVALKDPIVALQPEFVAI